MTIESLAAAWSLDHVAPKCRNRGPRGEYLGTLPGAEYCQWPTITRDEEWGVVGAHRDSVNGYSHMTWDRVFRTEASRSEFIDSLDQALHKRGLSSQPCRDGARRWTSERFAIEMSPITGVPGPPKVLVFATPHPEALPDLMCRRAPRPARTT